MLHPDKAMGMKVIEYSPFVLENTLRLFSLFIIHYFSGYENKWGFSYFFIIFIYYSLTSTADMNNIEYTSNTSNKLSTMHGDLDFKWPWHLRQHAASLTEPDCEWKTLSPPYPDPEHAAIQRYSVAIGYSAPIRQRKIILTPILVKLRWIQVGVFEIMKKIKLMKKMRLWFGHAGRGLYSMTFIPMA